MTPQRKEALLLEHIHPVAAELLTEAGFKVKSLDRALDRNELIDALSGVHYLGIRSTTYVTDEVLAAAPALQCIGAYCIGTNQIDVAAATGRGVAVFNAPFSNTRSVVELALAEIIALTRRLTEKNGLLHAGVWDKSASGAHEIRGRTLGIVGYGNVGTQISVLAENLGMRVIFYDVADRLALGNARAVTTLKDLLAEADVVTLHVDGRAGNRQMFGEQEFATMRSGSIFLNLSRGFVVDYVALRRNLLGGHIAGAALDVFPQEPRGRGDEFISELRGLPNVIMTPHIGGATEEAQLEIGRFVSGKFRDYALHGTTTLSVNLPVLDATRDGRARIAHLHHNVPGVLARVNGLLAEHAVNIESQALATRGEYGYALTDIEDAPTDAIIEQVRTMPETIGLQVLS